MKAKEMKKPSEQLHQYMPNTSRTLRALVDDNADAAARLNDCRAETSFCTCASKLPSLLLRCSQVKSFRPIFSDGLQKVSSVATVATCPPCRFPTDPS